MYIKFQRHLTLLEQISSYNKHTTSMLYFLCYNYDAVYTDNRIRCKNAYVADGVLSDGVLLIQANEN